MTSRRRVAAAVSYREGADGPEFLLVRTKGGDKWTFPKGHVEADEEPSDAALREAREEAGLVGEIDPALLAEYRYPKTRSRRGEDRVSAYLLRVEGQTPPAESFREPTWFSTDEARAKLAEGGREPRYAEQHSRVLDRAVEKLGAR